MIHPSAIVDPEARLDPSVEVGPGCVVGPGVKIGKGTVLKSHVVVEGWTELGEGNILFPFTVVGAVPQDLKYKGEKTKLIIGNNNTIREGVTINLGTVQGGGATQIGNGNLIMSYVHLGHDCRVGSHCVLSSYCGFAGHVEIEDYAIVGGMVGVSQFIRIGAHCYIGGCSALDHDVPPFCVAIGVRPAQVKGVNIVGLRRRGFTAEKIQKLNECVKLWTRPDVEKEQCLLEIESQYGDVTEVQQLVQFIRKSQCGVAKN